MVRVVDILAEIVWKEQSALQKMALVPKKMALVPKVATNQVSTTLPSVTRGAKITASIIVRSTKPTKATH